MSMSNLTSSEMPKINIKTPAFYSVYEGENLSAKLRGPRKLFTDATTKPAPGPSQLAKDEFAQFVDEIDSANNRARSVKDALLKHTSYQLVSVQTAETKFGTRQIWTLRFTEDDDMPTVMIWAPVQLSRYVLTDGVLDLNKVSCMKGYRIIYEGHSEDKDKKVARYTFRVLI